ncbi:TonB-dependent receptor [Brevundimonas sp. SGAir0440]|uniref:TonB-dependent receptor n=1 Tax=Brevundimonas sp. SGAir0440 TaxID=2579977 RepID=UPI0010CD408E|nr:TonB-dependent receptor [Brevundimonas sp. SGAir0440]QCQ97812.1 TonB-dependent receptor [Brevundimonas sp. SGAir0440]
MTLNLLMGAALAPMILAPLAMPAHADVDAVSSASTAVAGDVIYGRVTNAAGAPLPGAEVLVRGTSQRAVTNTQGEFTLPTASGAMVLEVNYLGLPSTSQTVVTTPGEDANVAIVLGAQSATDVADVIVTGVITDGVARSLNQQKNADGTVNVLSADAIGRYPDPNVAESLQRVQGIAIQRDQGEGRYINVRGAPAAFTAVSVDGVAIPAVSPTTRAVDLDTLPSDIVSSVEVSKTLTPAQDADSIAGAVDIKTRSPFDKRRLAVSGYAGGSYNDYGGQDYRAGANVSNVFGPDQTFGALVSVSFSETNRRPDNVENGWVLINRNAAQGGGQIWDLENTLFKDYETERTRKAVTGALEWRPSYAIRLWVKGSYAQFRDDEFRNTLNFTYSDGTLQPGSTDTSATFTNARIYKQLRHRTQENDISTLVLGGEQTFGNGAVWDGALSFANSKQTYPHRDELVYRSSATTLSYNTADHYQPTYSAFSEPTGFYLNPNNYSFRENTFRSNTTEQDDVAFKTNLSLPTVIGGREVELKFGAKYSTRDVTADEERFRDRSAAASSGALAPLLSDRPSRNYDYNLGFKFDAGLVTDYFDRVRAGSTNPDPAAGVRRIPQSITADYTAQEDILAGYGQARFDIGATNVLVGLRVEKTDFEGSATSVALSGAQSPVKVDRDQTDFFPNLTLRHSFSDQLVGRFALTRAISRPDYTDIVPRVLETTDSGRTTVTRGNPDLKPTLSNNVDAGLEYYLRPLGVISANAFYKDLSNYRFTLVTDGVPYVTPTTTVAQVTEARNARDGHIAGIEFNWQQTFDFLPGWASGFGVFANYTLTDAEIKTSRAFAGRDTFVLPGQSDETYNAALFYERYGFSARVSYTHRSDFLEAIDATNPGKDLYVEGRGQLDFTASYDFGNGVEVFGEAKNLTDSAGVRYYGVKERTYEYEKFGYNVFLGVRFKL